MWIRADALVCVKPHITLEAAGKAVEEIDHLLDAEAEQADVAG
jgi:hypothetical protein